MLHVGDVVTTLCERETLGSLKNLLLATDGVADMEAPKSELGEE